ncbi:hypothetical protein P175DRAFT_0426501 [Aspergillus ochraceoroseus IBT 24754]|uniref:Cytidyltransferase-like domain-containing protein n=2 Tax=Aspergillus ochraceoroseus TaxID=138278 RepID=A0A2T5M6C4_9EURO|nr:uncharacterized protein P175DRAFT_0426501 [Aspergillus ochraceoroseus IBT 24754]KKK21548.1 hypothetical protein AOCH_003221 [Aspergillus ochraceoroseus]PTU24085.1 hypothetical protein P175DRAFT_0426501 [Aspergillus ochraceoroseus IBT 24754]
MASQSPPSALLLLPPPPCASSVQFKAVYQPILSAVCTELSQVVNGTHRVAYLHVALSLSGLRSPACQPPAKAFTSLQRALEHIYTLIGVVCMERNIDMEAPGGIDSRVVLLDFDSVHSATSKSGESAPVTQNGPILDLQTLANSKRLWNKIYFPDTPAGQDLAAAFSSFHDPSKDPNSDTLQPVPGVRPWTPSESFLAPGEPVEPVTHYSAIVAGTFDHFHIGHKLLLTATALVLQPLGTGNADKERLFSIGVTGDEMLKNKKYPQYLESWEKRCRSTIDFLRSIMDFGPPEASTPHVEYINDPGPNGKVMVMKIRPGITLRLVQISDAFGPTITEESISALVVSKETRSGGAAVNQERKKRGFKQMVVFEVDVLHSGEVAPGDVDNFASKISSTDIRRRQMELAMI